MKTSKITMMTRVEDNDDDEVEDNDDDDVEDNDDDDIEMEDVKPSPIIAKTKVYCLDSPLLPAVIETEQFDSDDDRLLSSSSSDRTRSPVQQSLTYDTTPEFSSEPGLPTETNSPAKRKSGFIEEDPDEKKQEAIYPEAIKVKAMTLEEELVWRARNPTVLVEDSVDLPEVPALHIATVKNITPTERAAFESRHDQAEIMPPTEPPKEKEQLKAVRDEEGQVIQRHNARGVPRVVYSFAMTGISFYYNQVTNMFGIRFDVTGMDRDQNILSRNILDEINTGDSDPSPQSLHGWVAARRKRITESLVLGLGDEEEEDEEKGKGGGGNAKEEVE